MDKQTESDKTIACEKLSEKLNELIPQNNIKIDKDKITYAMSENNTMTVYLSDQYKIVLNGDDIVCIYQCNYVDKINYEQVTLIPITKDLLDKKVRERYSHENNISLTSDGVKYIDLSSLNLVSDRSCIIFINSDLIQLSLVSEDTIDLFTSHQLKNVDQFYLAIDQLIYDCTLIPYDKIIYHQPDNDYYIGEVNSQNYKHIKHSSINLDDFSCLRYHDPTLEFTISEMITDDSIENLTYIIERYIDDYDEFYELLNMFDIDPITDTSFKLLKLVDTENFFNYLHTFKGLIYDSTEGYETFINKLLSSDFSQYKFNVSYINYLADLITYVYDDDELSYHIDNYESDVVEDIDYHKNLDTTIITGNDVDIELSSTVEFFSQSLFLGNRDELQSTCKKLLSMDINFYKYLVYKYAYEIYDDNEIDDESDSELD